MCLKVIQKKKSFGCWRDVMMDNPEFSAIMQQATALKGEQVKQDRRIYENHPMFLQHTLFHSVDPNIIQARQQTIRSRLEYAHKLKDKGKEFFDQGKFLDASDQYERGIGCFWYIESLEPNWKTEGIKDEWLKYHRFEDEATSEIKDFIVILILNVALCLFKMNQWGECILACDQVLKLDPENSKALYRRAQARIVPPGSGGVEMEHALQDLKASFKSNPEDKAVRRLLAELVRSKDQQKKIDKQTFNGMFNRGSVIKEEIVSDTTEKEKIAQQQYEFYDGISKTLKAQGRVEDAQEIERVLNKTNKRKDYLNPDAAMIEDAKKHGLDLNDPFIREQLHSMSQAEKPEPNVVQQVSIFTPWVLVVSVCLFSILIGIFGR